METAYGIQNTGDRIQTTDTKPQTEESRASPVHLVILSGYLKKQSQFPSFTAGHVVLYGLTWKSLCLCALMAQILSKNYKKLQKSVKKHAERCKSVSKNAKKAAFSATFNRPFGKTKPIKTFRWDRVGSWLILQNKANSTHRRWGSCRRGRGCRTRWTS